MTSPLLSGECAATLMFGVLLTCFGGVLLVMAVHTFIKLVRLYRTTSIGQRLIKACAGDMFMVELVIANTEFAGGLIDEEMKRGLQLNQELQK